MEPKQHKFTFDIDQGTKEKIVVVTQDYAAHKFEISIVEDGYKPFNLANTVVRLMVIKPNGESKQQDCANVDEAKGKVSLLLALDVIDTPGTCKAEIQFWDTALANKRFTSSATFSFYVRKSMQDDTTAEGTDEFSVLQDALEEARNYGEVKDEVVTARGTSASLNDRLGTNENNLTSHLAEITQQVINVTRDISILGVQTISTIPNRKVRKISIKGIIPGTKMISFGTWTETGIQHTIYAANEDAYLFFPNTSVVIQSGADYTIGVIFDVLNNQFSISWEAPTGNLSGICTMTIEITYH